MREKISLAVVVVVIILAIFATVANYVGQTMDFTVFISSIYNGAQGDGLVNEEEGDHNQIHFSPVIWLFVGGWIVAEKAGVPEVEAILLLFLTLLIGGVAIAAYKVSKEEGGAQTSLAVLCLAVLLAPNVINIALGGLRMLPLCIGPLILLLDATDRERTKEQLLWMGVALLVREDVALATAALGLMGVIGRKKGGLVMLGTSLAYFILVSSFFLSKGVENQLEFYDAEVFGITAVSYIIAFFIQPLEVVKTIFQPSRISFLIMLMFAAWPAAIKWKKGWMLAIGLPAAVLLMTRENDFTSFSVLSGEYYFSALSAALLYLAIRGVLEAPKKWRKAVLALFVLTSIAQSGINFWDSQRRAETPLKAEEIRFVEGVKREAIENKASVAVSSQLARRFAGALPRLKGDLNSFNGEVHQELVVVFADQERITPGELRGIAKIRKKGYVPIGGVGRIKLLRKK